jgi:phosphatidylserine decarboxylase
MAGGSVWSVSAAVDCVQPGGGTVLAVVRAWGRLRRGWLRAFHPGYVARSRARRHGDCPSCPHDIIDERDLRFFRNVCGFRFDEAEPDAPRLRLAEYGWGEVVLLGGPLLLLALLLALSFPWAAPVPAVLAGFVVWFFRDPPRQPPAEPGLVSPADGRVTQVERLDSADVWGGPAVKVSIYLSLFDVHLIRAPESARVVEVSYHPGRRRLTRRADCGRDNEQFRTLLECAGGTGALLLVKQVAGPLASRVVNTVRPGEAITRGQRIGMIKFGSRTELYLEPRPGLEVCVRPGDRLRAGESVVARDREDQR